MATSEYTLYELEPGEFFERDIRSNETFENVLIDATAEGAAMQINARGSNWTIRNVGLRGQLPNRDESAFRLQVDRGAIGVFEHIYLGDGAVDGGYAGVFVPTTHAGILQSSEINVQNWPDNGVYASATGRAERGGRGGLVEIERSYARNNNVAGFRLGTDRSSVRDSVVLVDERPPANEFGQVTARGVWVKEGGSILIEDSDILLANPAGSYSVVEGDNNSVGLALVVDSEAAARNGAEGRFKGNVETVNVGDDPDVSRPPGVPTSAEAAAAAGQEAPSDEQTIIIRDLSGEQENDYSFTVTGTVERLDDPQGDEVNGDTASGTVAGGADGYSFTGEITALEYESEGPLEVEIGGTIVDPDTIGQDQTDDGGDGELTTIIINDPDGEQPNNYGFSVTGEVSPLDDPRGDIARGRGATGIVFGGADGYEYTGELYSFVADGTVEVIIDGEQVDPDTLP